jgi:outer membrane protein assembly factor BamB
MRNILTLLLLGVLLQSGTALAESAEDNWPTWRGPTINGIALNGNPPTTWSETENIKWKIELPGTGSSTPIVWGDKMFIQVTRPSGSNSAEASTSATNTSLDFNLVCLSRTNGEVLWERTAIVATPHEGHHPTANFAPYSAVTDGTLLWASFGSRGLYCYDLDGNKKWEADLIEMKKRMSFGEGSSPALAGDNVVVLLDHEGDSKIMAFNKDTGALAWETERAERTSWTTPVPVQVGDDIQVVTSATNYIRSYDAKTGELIWECKGQTLNTIPTPLQGFGNVYCTSGFRGAALQAIKLGATGDLTDTKSVVWEVDQGTPYVASPVLYDDKIFLLSGLKAILSCYDAKSGKALFVEERLSGLKQIYASPVGAGGHVYIPDREGTTMVIKNSGTLEVVATNELDDGFDASPVVIGDELYLKGNQYLYCIAAS